MRRKFWALWKLIFAKHWYFCSFDSVEGDGHQWYNGLRVGHAEAIKMQLTKNISDTADQENALREFHSIINKT